jgi:glycine betaine/proline transport system permease protein
MLLLAVNQTILFALSMVVIAGLIGGQGLGDSVTNGLYTDPALAVLAGAAIVILAISLDRSTEAIADRTDPAKRHESEGSERRKHALTAMAAVTIALAVAFGHVFHAGADYTRFTAQDWLRHYVQNGLDYVQNPSTFVFHITSPIGNFLDAHGLEPLRSFFVGTPWPVMWIGFVAIAFLLSGWRPALTMAVMLLLIGWIGEWANAMDTASQVLVATGIVVILGIVLGVAAAQYKPIEVFLRPINDVLQTLPQLVYIIPFIYLVPVSKVPGLVASVLYAVPVVIRLVTNGIREVPAETVEAARAFGATERQVLLKVKIPLAGKAIMLGINQGIIMVLSVVVIAGLVGSGALGFEVAQGLQRAEFGQGVIASLAILALGIGIDRATRGGEQRRAKV